jgi:hypothetical protein
LAQKEDSHGKTEAETEVILSSVKDTNDCWQPQESRREKERFFCRDFGGSTVLLTP